MASEDEDDEFFSTYEDDAGDGVIMEWARVSLITTLLNVLVLWIAASCINSNLCLISMTGE